MNAQVFLLFLSFFFAIKAVWKMDGESSIKNTWFSSLSLSFYILTKVHDGLFYINAAVTTAIVFLGIVFVRTAAKSDGVSVESKKTWMLQLLIALLPTAAYVYFPKWAIVGADIQTPLQSGTLFLLTTVITAFIGIGAMVLLKTDSVNEREGEE